jgi:hypothetical protein
MKPLRATTTLGDLHRATPWLWLNCERCQHHAPLACAVAVIRWGRDASSNVLRERARCMRCGHKGATLQHPGWAGANVGFIPFPVHKLLEPTPVTPALAHNEADRSDVPYTPVRRSL